MDTENSNPNIAYGRWIASPPPGEEVIISGMSGRFPDTNSVRELRDNLINKKEMISNDDRRWNIHHPQIPQRGARIHDIDKLDAGFFGLHYRQVHNMDPLIRTSLEPVIEAIMDAGFNPSELAGTKTGVFWSACFSDSEIAEVMKITERQTLAITGYLRSLISHRISYYLKLKGSSSLLDTACSSSSNAFDQAFKAIRNGHCDNAIVGAANVILHPGSTLQFFLLGILNAEGRCKVFDKDADGYVRGETTACLFLQKAKNSRRIYARIIHTKSNCDGFKEQGITFPSLELQRQLMNEIYVECNVNPSDLSYLEAHGTGTAVGDPQEIEAIDSAIAKKRQRRLLVGSVKSSIGHTEPSSGINSIIKVLLAMESGVISPNINLQQVKKMSGIEEGRIEIVRELTKLEGDDAIVGINNFGFGGSNVHAILQRFRKTKINRGLPPDDLPRLVCVSGRTEQAIRYLLNDINNESLDFEYVGLLHQIFKINIENHLYRGFTILSKDGPIEVSTRFHQTQQSSLYLVFGPFVGNFKILGAYLWKFPIFRDKMSTIDNILLQKKMKSFAEVLTNETKNYEDFVASVCVQIVLVDIFKDLEMHPVAVYGDSHHKIVSEYYYDVITLEEAISNVVKLSQLVSNFNLSLRDKKTTSENKVDSLNPKTIDAKNVFVFNISDHHLNYKDVLPVEGNVVKILEVLGSLYEEGHTLQLHRLYPEVEFPVSRNTPMISSSIQWDHTKSWHTYKFSEFKAANIEQKEYYITTAHVNYKYLQGHIIDGRNLVPASEYLHLVWLTFVKNRYLGLHDVPVTFEDCKFVRAVTVPKSGYIVLLVTIQKGTNYFEVVEKDSVVVSGRMSLYSEETDQQIDLKPWNLDDQDPTQILEQDEIYRELYLRGYNYSGAFKGIVKCNIEGTTGLIRWDDNWTSFIDKIFQMMILGTDSRLLYVPVAFKKITIIPARQLQFARKLGSVTLFPVHVYKDCNVIKSGGVEIIGLQVKSISRKKTTLEPVLEKSEFVPNCSSFDLLNAVRVNTQIILENSLETNFKAVEIIDDCTHSKNHLLHLVYRALQDIPVVIPDLTISSKTNVEATEGVKVEHVILTPESRLLLLIGTKLLERRTNLAQILSCVSENGFLLTREELSFTPQVPQTVEILTEFTTPNEKLFLFRKHKDTFSTFLEISSGDFKWLPQLQSSMKNDPNVVVYSRNEDGGVLGLVNCIRREPHGNKLKCFFLMDEAPQFNPEIDFYKTQIRKNLAVNIFREKKWGTYRHLLLEEPDQIECEHCYAKNTTPGKISSLKWLEGGITENTPLPEDRILVKTFYSAVNFKDIMTASGRVGLEIITTDRLLQEIPIGFEFSGVDLKGRRVAGMSDKSLSSYVVASKEFSWEVPDSWTLEDAATATTVYWTVIYAFLVMTDLKPGTSVLIHSATGGVGLAAVNVCLHHKCDIYVTVGTQEKRTYLRKHYPQIPESHIGNSRDTSFKDMIKIETKGRGVEIVLNSLSEDKLKASVQCLAPGGSFMEIGKYDPANDTSLNLLLLEKGASYHGLMLDKIYEKDQARRLQVQSLFMKGLADGFVKPLPRIVFDREEVESAYRYMMTGQHKGKVLLKIRDEANLSAPDHFMAYPRFVCDARCSYVIVGGLGGIGLELADWLMLRGCKKLILTSRSGIQNGYQTQRISIWKSYGVQVVISTKSATNNQGCIDIIQEANKLGPVDGVFNLAVVLRDALFQDQTEEAFLDSMAPKAEATKNLDRVTRELCPKLRYFVVFSSVSCGRGNKGQSNYGMANSIMERICERRKLDKLPALAIQWGAIGEVGLVAKMQKENKELVIGGTLQQKISSCFEVLDRFLKQKHPVVSSMVVAEKYKRDILTSPIEAVAHILGIKDIKTVSQHVTLAELGMDSMMGTELIQILEKDFDIYITARDVRSLTFAKLRDIENERKDNLTEKEVNKSQLGANLLIQYIPESTNDQFPIIRLPSRVKESDEAITAFVLPGIEGVFHPLENLTRELKMHVIGVRYRYNHPEDTIQGMASYVVPHIEEKLCKGSPFFLIGYSMGTLVALEAASLLESRGYSGTVVLIDGTPASIKTFIKTFFPSGTESAFQTALLYRIFEIILPFGKLSQYKDKILECETLSDRIDLCLDIIPSTVIGKGKLEKQAAIALYKRLKASLDYKFVNEQIKSQVYLFKAKYSTYSGEADEELAKMCEKSAQVTTLDGDHLTVLKNPELAKGINEVA